MSKTVQTVSTVDEGVVDPTKGDLAAAVATATNKQAVDVAFDAGGAGIALCDLTL